MSVLRGVDGLVPAVTADKQAPRRGHQAFLTFPRVGCLQIKSERWHVIVQIILPFGRHYNVTCPSLNCFYTPIGLH